LRIEAVEVQDASSRHMFGDKISEFGSPVKIVSIVVEFVTCWRIEIAGTV
jgi:hypothetical protein